MRLISFRLIVQKYVNNMQGMTIIGYKLNGYIKYWFIIKIFYGNSLEFNVALRLLLGWDLD